jgi:phosphatidylserine/phosphatidylglycerophosphate/cardiolipin synthase-like enzyme
MARARPYVATGFVLVGVSRHRPNRCAHLSGLLTPSAVEQRDLGWLGLSLWLVSSAALSCGGDETTPINTASGSGGSGGTGGTGAGGAGGDGASAGSGGTATGPDVVINEIMANPNAVLDDAGEWVELFNAGDGSADLEGWTLRDGGSNSHTIGSALVVAPGGYVVLARNGDAQSNGGVAADYAYGEDFTLANAGDSVILEDDSASLVDSVAYGVAAPWPINTPGISIELDSPTLDNAAGASWSLAVLPYGDGDLGTPGGPNGGSLTGYTVDNTVLSWHQPTLSASVHFAPLDSMEDHVFAQLAQATTSIRLAFFNIRLPGVKTLLDQKVTAGLDVHVLLDHKQQAQSYNTMADELTQLGVPVTLIENTLAVDATMHDKFAVIDGHRVMTGSANYSYTALNVSDEELLTFDDAALAARYQVEFDELIAAGTAQSTAYTGNPPLQVWMGPEDGLYNRVINALDGAQSTALVAMFQLNSTSIVDALIAAQGRGVDVVVVLDEVQATDPQSLADEALVAAAVPVILAHATGGNYAEMHSKFLVVDHQLVLMGSYNWTNLGSYYNDETMVVIDDAHLADRFEGKFAEMLDGYNAPTPTSLGLVEGAQQVSFEVTNVTLDPGVELTIQSDGGGPFATPVALNGTTLTTSIAAGSRVTYHYAIVNGGSTLAIEGAPHHFTVPYAQGPFAVTDAFTP